MEIEFKENYLQELYEEGKTKDKRFKSNPQLVKQYIKTINKLRDATKIEQLYQLSSLNYDKKQGNLKGKSAVYINQQYRLIFEEIPDASPPYEIKILEIEEISKHYE